MEQKFIITEFTEKDLSGAIRIWNSVVKAGKAFPQEEELSEASAMQFFQSQSRTGIAREKSTGAIAGLYILHPNNVGRCGHICNASYAVADDFRGQHLGEMLVRDSLAQAAALGFLILQFNAVVASNTTALNLYKKLGFTQLGVIPGGFRNLDGVYEDIIPHYIKL